MAKKRRSRKSAARSSRTTTPPTAVASSPTPVAPAVDKPARGDAVDFASEYHYVLGDLKRIGLLAVAMFATLIGLALIIQ